MTKERLEELQDLAYDAVGSHAEKVYGEALSEACSEIERLMAALAVYESGGGTVALYCPNPFCNDGTVTWSTPGLLATRPCRNEYHALKEAQSKS